MLKDLVRLARPAHWIKNVLVLVPVVTSLHMSDARAWGQALIAAAAFCLAASAVYVVNDLNDRVRDRVHPRKRHRPIASGAVSSGAAWAEAGVLLAASLIVAALAGWLVLVVIAAYLVLQALYTLALSRAMLLDVICIALGLVLRAVAGAVAIGVDVSLWLFVCTFTLFLFMGFCKRCNEIVTLGGDAEAHAHRPTLAGYSGDLLTHLITLSAAIAVVAFLAYATSAGTVRSFGTPYLVYTLPVVIYAIFRFAMLSMRGQYSDPVEIILRDRAFQVTLVLWAAMALAVICQGVRVGAYLRGLLR